MGDLGHGVLIKTGDGASPEVFTAIAEIIGVSGPGSTLDTVEDTHTESSDKHKTFIAGLIDAGEVSLDMNFLPANATQSAAAGILKDHIDRTLRNFQLVFPDTGTSTCAFAAFVTNHEPTAPIEDRMTASVTLKLTGKPTWS